MALVHCIECDHEMSRDAKSCPKCGEPNRRTKLSTWIIAGVLTFAVGSCIINQASRDEETKLAKTTASNKEAQRLAAMSPADREYVAAAKAKEEAQKAKEEAQFQRLLAIAAAVKKDSNDPSAIKFEEAWITDDGSYTIKFRGKNAFGAYIVNHAIVTRDGKTFVGTEEKSATLHNKYIANKSGRDLSKSLRGAQSMGVI